MYGELLNPEVSLPSAVTLLLAVFALAGVPPIGKWYLFRAAMQEGLWWLVLLGAVSATIFIYYYPPTPVHDLAMRAVAGLP